MTIKERIDNEQSNLTRIFLYYDKGLFFNLVERSAYAFHTQVKPFKVNVKKLKGLAEPYISMGFPVSKRDDYLKGLSYVDDGMGCITALLNEPIDENDYQAWKAHIVQQYLSEQKTGENKDEEETHHDNMVHEPAKTEYENTSVMRQYLMEIKMLNIAGMTPMETIMFLHELQQKIKNVL